MDDFLHHLFVGLSFVSLVGRAQWRINDDMREQKVRLDDWQRRKTALLPLLPGSEREQELLVQLEGEKGGLDLETTKLIREYQALDVLCRGPKPPEGFGPQDLPEARPAQAAPSQPQLMPSSSTTQREEGTTQQLRHRTLQHNS